MTSGSRSNLLRTFGAVSSRLRDELELHKRPQAPSGTAVIAGSSHIICFGVPLRSGRVDLLPLSDGEGRFMCLNGPFPRTTSYWRRMERLARRHKLFLNWQGNQHMAEHLFASTPPFDFVLAERPDLPLAPEAAIVAEQMLREKFGQARSFERLAALLTRIAERGTPGVYVCGTPPPKGDTGAIRAALGREDYFVERLAKLGTDPQYVPLTPPETLYKLWNVVQSMLREVTEARGATFVPIPAEAQTPEGFLRKEFWGPDITHANESLGPVVLRMLARYL